MTQKEKIDLIEKMAKDRWMLIWQKDLKREYNWQMKALLKTDKNKSYFVRNNIN